MVSRTLRCVMGSLTVGCPWAFLALTQQYVAHAHKEHLPRDCTKKFVDLIMRVIVINSIQIIIYSYLCYVSQLVMTRQFLNILLRHIIETTYFCVFFKKIFFLLKVMETRHRLKYIYIKIKYILCIYIRINGRSEAVSVTTALDRSDP